MEEQQKQWPSSIGRVPGAVPSSLSSETRITRCWLAGLVLDLH